ncbi:ABC transporter transmembrane domain-containing protein [Arthrobacter sp. NPDC090010]|uniref:ABC transporter transmembrane domain-containing protein n=1 Tax=Arthrobacter sp. NPDC090010 TaxID=3363942 RepID=UPI003817DE98
MVSYPGLQTAPERSSPQASSPSAPPATSRAALLWRTVLSRPRDLAAAAVLYSTHQLGEALVPVIIGATISQAIGPTGTPLSIALWLGVLAADFVFLSFSYRFGARASMRSKQHAAHQARLSLAGRIVLGSAHRGACGDGFQPGDLLTRASSDANRVGAFAGVVASTIAAVVALIAASVFLFGYSPVLAAVILLGTLALLAVQRLATRLLGRRSAVEQDRQAQATGFAEDIVRGLRVLRGIGAQRAAVARYRGLSQEASTAALSAASAGALPTSLHALFTGLYLSVVAGLGGMLALEGQLSLGALISALGLAQFLAGPLGVLSAAHAAQARALASAARIQEILTLAPGTSGRDTPGLPGTPAGPGVLDLRGLHPVGGPLLDVRLEPGSFTGVVCGSAITATSLTGLLAREEEAGDGAVLLDGVDVRDREPGAGGHGLLVALHEAALLPGTIGENLGALTLDPQAIRRASRAAAVDQLLDVVPQGAASPVGDRGERLSGGQRQRLVLARALAAESPALVLHDPTTAVDPVTEDGIAERVRWLRAGHTTMVVTTSPAWLSRCEHVLFLHDGALREGTHGDLLASDAAYREAVAR